MTQQVRTRFAPSPTGFLHVGSIRTALFDWLFTRHNGGVFVLRIEDTDATRKVEGAVEAILDDLRWLNLDWNEGPEVGGKYGPYIQSERLERYKEAARRLLAQGAAYKCYCSQERLEALRAHQTKNKLPPGYDRCCRNLTEAERAQKEKEGITPVVRLKTPLEGQTIVHDIIWGNVIFKNSAIEDLVLLKSDGYPTYHLANIVDDHDMQITHVIRAEEWMSSTPCHILMYNAMGYEVPQFAHLPMLLGSDRSKLGKRHGSTSIRQFREDGYLPETMINFLALLGWSLDDKTEIIPREDLIKHFSLERVNKTAAIFNHEKLQWMNGVYIRQLTNEDFVQRVLPFLEKGLPVEVKRPLSIDYVRKVMPLVKERVKILSEAPELTKFFFTGELNYDSNRLLGKGMAVESTTQALTVAKERLEKQANFDAPALEALLRPLAEELKLKAGQLFGALRTAVSGELATPPLFDMIAVLGKERTLVRIDDALSRLAGM
ncbi:MAG: glutamate--tRNA ligase [Dehalococcoidales bacterium]|nr:glutamate--tRNA ligase [Dehalococcoidales bacterium]